MFRVNHGEMNPIIMEKNFFELIRKTIFASRFNAVIMFLLFLAVALVSMLPPIILGYVVKHGIIQANFSVLLYLALVFLLVMTSISLLNLIKAFLFRGFQIHFIHHVQSFIIDRMFKLPLEFFDRYTVGELLQRSHIIEPLTQIISESQLGACLSFICSFISFSIMMYYDWQLTSYILFFVAIFFLLSTWSAFKLLPNLEAYLEHISQTVGFLFQVISGILTIKSYSKESAVAIIGAEKYCQARQALFRAHRLGIWRYTLLKNIQLFMTLLVFAIIFSRDRPNLSFDHFIIFFSAFMQFIVGFVIFSMNQNSMVPAVTTYKRLQPIFQTPVEKIFQQQVSNSFLFSGDISVEHLHFRYPAAITNVLQDVNCTIPFGQHTAIVGRSGSGKSTLLKLLLGVYTPQQGEIHFGNENIQQLDLLSLRQQVGIVLQNSKLIHGSILENIVGANENEDEAWRVVSLVGLDRFINSLPMKMHTIITQHMNLISGGQKQLLLIAKALVGQPRLLIFDEATNSLDNISQDIVVKCINQLNMTRISIAHRLSTIKEADHIMVLHQGTIIETGKYQQLIQQQGSIFYQLVKQQSIDLC